MRFLFVTLCLSLLFTLPIAAVAEAKGKDKCICSPNSFSSRWNEANAVFVGTVDTITVAEKYVQYGNTETPVEVSLSVNDAYKGTKIGDTFLLHTNLAIETCTGHPFEEKQKYLVFAYKRSEDKYEVWSMYNFPSDTWDVGGLCGGTKLFTDAATSEDLNEIAKMSAPPAPEKKQPGFMNKLFNP